MKQLLEAFNDRLGLILWLVFFIWLKTMFAYFLVMDQLHSSGIIDYLLMIANPVGFTFMFFAILLFIKPKKIFYTSVALMDFVGSLLVYGNVVYYREFTDFLSVATVTGGAGMMGKGFDFGSVPIQWFDFIFWIDFILIFTLIILKRIKMDEKEPARVFAFKVFSLALMIFSLTFWFGDFKEHRLVSRQAQYDDTYVVRYLGFGPWLVTNGWYTNIADQARAVASKSDFTKVQQYVQEERYLAPNVDFVGQGSNAIAKNRNVIVIHLESFQQDLIDLKINGKEVTPFINSIYHSNSSYSFSNFYHQVGQGKTSDAEIMLETSSFGLPSGSIFTQLGGSQTFQSMPAILKQSDDYTSAVFHANLGSFYNRNNVYRQMGYENFFDSAYWEKNPENSSGWGIKDKALFYQSVEYLEQLQQPFYVKYLTVSNHTPFTGLSEEEMDPDFVTTDSGSEIVDNYFLTAHYLDEAIKEFFDYLKVTGLYDNSIFVLYGDHYGISGNDTKNYAQAIGINPQTWTDYDNTQMQRVPLMINVPGQTNGHISDKLAGQIDMMPTIEHMLGINTENYIQLGQDLFASGREEFVALRNRGFVTPNILKPTGASEVYYDTKTGEVLVLTPEQELYVEEIQEKVDTLLDMSDALNSEDLLRFYTPSGFTPVNPSNLNYTVDSTETRLAKQLENLKAKSTALISEYDHSTIDLYKTREPSTKPSSSSSSEVSSSSSSSKKGDE